MVSVCNKLSFNLLLSNVLLLNVWMEFSLTIVSETSINKIFLLVFVCNKLSFNLLLSNVLLLKVCCELR